MDPLFGLDPLDEQPPSGDVLLTSQRTLFSALKEGDVIEAFSTEKLAADLGALTTAKA